MFRLVGNNDVAADVTDVQHEIRLVDARSRPLPLPGQSVQVERPRWRFSFVNIFRLNWCGLLWNEGCSRCRRRATRLVVECIPTDVSLPRFAVDSNSAPPE